MDVVAEKRRLEGLRALRSLEGDHGPSLDRIVRLAVALTGAPQAAIHVIDAIHQHRVAAVGAPLESSPRKDSMCQVVMESGGPIASDDASVDARFDFSSATSGDNPVRFFAATPLHTEPYGALGTLCVWDTQPHEDAERVLSNLADLAAVVIDSLEAARLVQLLAEAAATDELTDLPNRRLIYDSLNRELARKDRHDGGVAVAYIDLNGFKVINDTHGHDIGDIVLAETARRLRKVVRADELVGRIGGDEFVVIATAGMAQAEAVKRLGEAVREPVDTAVGSHTVSASIGVATATMHDTADSLLRRADREMYAAKRAAVAPPAVL